MKRKSPNPGSHNDWLATFAVGERRYLETTPEDYPQTMRTVNTPVTRRPAVLQGREFSASLFTAIAARKVGEVRYLICIERVK